MGLLDYADAARKKLAGILGDMPLVQIAQGRAEMPTRAGLLGALKSIPVFSPDAGQSAYEAAINIGPMGLGKIVYHGSPHKFHKFDASKIGTGEGAQAYGHGVYLADSERVAEGYAKELQGKVAIEELRKLQSSPAGDAPIHTAKDMFSLGNPEEEIARVLQQAYPKLQPRLQQVAIDAARPGSLYKADLPDEWIPKMLDWDKPLSQQSPEVKFNLGGTLVDKNLMDFLAEAKRSDVKGGTLVKALEENFPKQLTSTFWTDAGIPGIRYLDGGSRGKGQGSYNYVVFPGLEDQVKILERNGVPLSGLLGGK